MPPPYAAASIESPVISASTIGIQTIMPQTGTSPQTPPPPQSQPANDNVADTSQDSAPKPAPPPPGMGKFVDKTI